MQIQDQHIAFIGAGNMATALIEGLLTKGFPCTHIWAADPNTRKLEKLAMQHGINITRDNSDALRRADTVILAVKPQLVQEVLAPLKDAINSKQCLVISIAAGISIAALQAMTNSTQPLIRCMPNTPALVQAGAAALYANAECTELNKVTAQAILEAVGTVSWLENESDMDTVTALSGSGPAYFFLFIEALREAAIAHGLAEDIADALAKQTAFGAAKLALQSEDDVSELRQKVTSPGGTTAAALAQLEKDDFKTIIARAITQAKLRSEELAQLTK